MAISTASGKGNVNANINVTPMIDVMLVLLIIFMIVTPLLEAGFTATMPLAANTEQKPEGEDEITLGVDQGGNFFLDKKPVTKEQLEQQLTADYATRTKDKLLYFKADENLKYSKIQEAIEIGRRAGARQLIAITAHTGGLMGGNDKKKGK
ncbi:MAG TPA: biopolymer transporter ExbD [Gemmatimonadales bacterium]